MDSAVRDDQWCYREGGVVLSAIAPADVTADCRLKIQASNGYVRIRKGEDPTEEQTEAMALLRVQGVPASQRLLQGPAAQLGFLGAEHPELLKRLDQLAVEIADALGALEPAAWRIMQNYADSAEWASLQSLGGYTLDPPPHPNLTQSDEQARAILEEMQDAAIVLADGGPDGWSTVRPPEGHPYALDGKWFDARANSGAV